MDKLNAKPCVEILYNLISERCTIALLVMAQFDRWEWIARSFDAVNNLNCAERYQDHMSSTLRDIPNDQPLGIPIPMIPLETMNSIL